MSLNAYTLSCISTRRNRWKKTTLICSRSVERLRKRYAASRMQWPKRRIERTSHITYARPTRAFARTKPIYLTRRRLAAKTANLTTHRYDFYALIFSTNRSNHSNRFYSLFFSRVCSTVKSRAAVLSISPISTQHSFIFSRHAFIRYSFCFLEYNRVILIQSLIYCSYIYISGFVSNLPINNVTLMTCTNF